MKEYTQADDAKILRGSMASLYDYFSTGLEGDVQFYVEEAIKAGSPVLELGCGTGRILIPVAEAGVNAFGLDNSPEMLAIAKQKVSRLDAETQQRIQLVKGDMRDFSLGQQFKLIMIPYRVFLHLLTPEDQRRALACIREHLADDGRLILNIFDPRLDIFTQHAGPLGASMKMNKEFVHPDTGRRFLVWDTRKHDMERQIIEMYFIFEELDDDGRVISKTYSPLTLRYAFRYEMQYLLELCGYRIEALYGDFRRGSFRYAGEQIWVARIEHKKGGIPN